MKTEGSKLFAILILGFFIGYIARNDYRQGQIDVLTGHIKYELTTRPNGEKLWTEKKEQP